MVKYIKNTNYNTYVNADESVKMNYVINSVLKDLLPRLEENTKKCCFVGLMCNKLVKTIIGLYEEDDRDSYANKRIETTGYLMANLTYQCLNRIVRDIKSFLNREISSGNWNDTKDYNEIINEINICKLIKSSYIETS